MSIAGLYDGIDMTKVMYGKDAFHIPINMISLSGLGDGRVAGVFQTSMGLPLLGGSERSHVLMLGDAVFRPRIIVGSDHCRGRGIGGLYTCGFTELNEWVKGDIVLGKL